MKRMRQMLTLTSCVTALFCLSFDRAAAQQAVPLENGPVHEAYISASSGTVLMQAVANQPPAMINEVQPPQCSDDAIWIPGYWAWDASMNDFLWVSGVWRVAPPDHHWVAGKWQQFDSGWVWLRGFWSVMPAVALNPIANRPPDPIEEKGVSKPSDDAFWISGFWHYDFPSSSYKWLSGKWETFDPNWVYVPAHYVWRDGGYILIAAYWDWPLERRGCAYSAISIDPVYRETIIYQPWVILTPQMILHCSFLWYPDYATFFWHYWHFDPGWCCVIPPWWSWDSCWCFNEVDGWWFWWWWTHPSFPHPFWMTAQLSNQIAPAPQQLLNSIEAVAPPLNVLPWGVVKPSALLQAIEDETGSDDPIMPADSGAAGRIRDTLRPSKSDQGTSLRPSGDGEGQPDVRPDIETPSLPPAQQGGRVTIPKKPAAPPNSDASSTPPLVPSKPPVFRAPKYSPERSYTPPPTRRSPPAQPRVRQHPRRRTPPSYMPPSYQPKRYTPPSRRDGPIDKPSVDQQDAPTIRWPWREPNGETPMPRYPEKQRIYRFEARENYPERAPPPQNSDDMFY